MTLNSIGPQSVRRKSNVERNVRHVDKILKKVKEKCKMKNCLNIVCVVLICILLRPDDGYFVSGCVVRSVVHRAKALGSSIRDRLCGKTSTEITATQLSNDEKEVQSMMGYVKDIDKTVQRVSQVKYEKLKNMILRAQSDSIVRKYGELIKYKSLFT